MLAESMLYLFKIPHAMVSGVRTDIPCARLECFGQAFCPQRFHEIARKKIYAGRADSEKL
jgi:hypothetical protein